MRKRLIRFFAATAVLTSCAFITSTAQNSSPYWSLAGNSNASNTTSKLGTTNGINLRLYTNNAERMRILSTNGFVGIGTTAPNARLHINTTSATTPLRVQVNGTSKLLLSSNGGLSVGSTTIAPANGLYVAGKVGIGSNTQVTGYKLHVSGGGIKVSQYWETGESDVSYGIHAEGATGVHGSGMTGVSGDGMVGVEGSGSTGVYGYGSSAGIEGYSDDGSAGYFYSSNGTGLIAETTKGTYAGEFHGAVYLSNGYTTSDKNLKQNVKEFDGALGIISKLKPRNYEFKIDEKYTFLHLPKGSHYGLMAQDVEEVLPNLVSTASHQVVKTAKHSDIVQSDANTGRPVRQLSSTEKREIISIKALNYTELIPIIVKGMQELNAKTTEVESLKTEISDLKERLSKLEAILTKGNSITSISSAYLEQNTPNPASGTTTIRYHVPEQSTSARLTLTNAKGQVIKTISLSNKSSGQVNLNTMALAAGTYHYTLYVDGELVNTKRLVIAR